VACFGAHSKGFIFLLNNQFHFWSLLTAFSIDFQLFLAGHQVVLLITDPFEFQLLIPIHPVVFLRHL
jgi:hypothetical protein